ncbi:MAG TPA: hypothetical protein HA362_02895 [Nanoarchaeota archaeon]|nr:hypothetical protein [Nanoarchaeota archaeon]
MLLTDREHNPILQFPEQAKYAFNHSQNPQFSCLLFHPPQECVKQLEAIAQEDVDKAIASGVLLLQMEKFGDSNNPIYFADFKTNPVTRFLGWDKSEQLFGGQLHYRVDFNIKPKEERLKKKEAFAFPLMVHQLSPYWTLDGAGFYSFYKRIFGVQLQAGNK